MDSTRILTRREIATVLADHDWPHLAPNKHLNAIVFRLSCCCGLRAKEICGLNLGDFIVTGDRPGIRVRKEITKGIPEKRKARMIPLWWDAGTRSDLAEWLEYRRRAGATKDDPFICSLLRGHEGKRFNRKTVAKRWTTAIGVLGSDRVSQLSIHCGRHSFCSHSIAIGRNLMEVKNAAGHVSINTTSHYLHLVETGRKVPDVFNFTENSNVE